MIHIILGTKAQLIKMAPVMRALLAAGLEYRLITTGQHRETMEDIYANFGIRTPDYSLYDGADITSIPAMIIWSARISWHVFRNKRAVFGGAPRGVVLVHGDTFSTLLGTLIGRFVGLKVGHVESGLRSFNLFHPFPEELIRIATIRLSDILYCPGTWAVANVSGTTAQVVNTGSNTLVESLQLALLATSVVAVDAPTKPFAIVSIHRVENIYSEKRLRRIVEIVLKAAEEHFLLFVLHKPTEQKLKAFGLYDRIASNENIELRPRYDYVRFISLVRQARFVISDGGSNQEECHYLGKPVLLLREATERQEGLGTNCVLSHYDPSSVARFLSQWRDLIQPPSLPITPPSQCIVEHLRQINV